MEGMELIAFEIISNVGTAKSLAVEALRDAREGKYEEAEEKCGYLKKELQESLLEEINKARNGGT